MRRTWAGVAVVASLVVAVAGCAPSPGKEEPASAAPSAAQSQSTSASPGAAQSTSASPSAGTATPPSDPPAAAAWEALMAPDGEYESAASYQAVLDEFGEVEPYASILRAEERHVAALARQLERLGVEVPDDPYTGTVAAPPDLESAAEAWAAGEVANIALYDRMLEDVDGDRQLTRVFTNLRRASEEVHLPAFRLAADHGGVLTDGQLAELGIH